MAAPRRSDAKRVYVVVVNWNGWRDTLECLESVLRSDHPNFQVVVCDNASDDGSLDRLAAWAEGQLDTWVAPGNPLRCLSFPPLPKPIPWSLYTRDEAEAGGSPAAADARLVLVQTGGNLGFGGGTNVGIRYALARGDAEYVWLLNNDTVVAADALSRLVDRLSSCDRAGLCGSTLLYYSSPERVQALGGFAYNRWLGTSRMIRHLAAAEVVERTDPERVERRMFGVQGASMLASRRAIEAIGLLAEQYFLYFEEQDWAARARAAGLGIAYAPQSLVYHREGATTGGHGTRPKSWQSDYFSIRARLLFTRRFYPYAIPFVWLGLLGTLVNRVRRRQFDRIPMILGLAIEILFRGGAARDALPPRVPESHRKGAVELPSIAG